MPWAVNIAFHKLIFFLFNEGEYHTECKAGYQYEAKWKYDEGKYVSYCLPIFFKIQPDRPPQPSEIVLILSRKQRTTHDGYFKSSQTFLACVVVHTWVRYTWYYHPNNRHNSLSLLQRTNKLALNLVQHTFSKAPLQINLGCI